MDLTVLSDNNYKRELNDLFTLDDHLFTFAKLGLVLNPLFRLTRYFAKHIQRIHNG